MITITPCVFCQIAKDLNAPIVDIEPLNPVVPGHIIVFSKDHSKDFADNPNITKDVVEYASKLAKRLGGDWNLITSKGASATQTVFHLHVHLVPRKPNDGIILPWTFQI